MKIKQLRSGLNKYLLAHGLKRKFDKQVNIFTDNPRHPSLHTEMLLPKNLKIYSFRIDRKYRAIFILLSDTEAEIIDINDHYQ